MNSGVVLVLAALALSGCGGGSSPAPVSSVPPPGTSVAGDLKVQPSTASITGGHVRVGDPCTSGDGYEDIHADTQLVIADEKGATLALGRLSAGRLSGIPGHSVFSLECSYSFMVTGVPDDHSFYKVSVGRRGSEEYTREEIASLIHLELS